MDPLIDLPEPAKARIKEREAELEEQLDSVRRAFDHDLARAAIDWGRYVDLYQEKRIEAVEEVRRGSDDAGRISAQCVFLAHSDEYRQVLRSPGELAPVVEELREAVIRKYGEHTRKTVERIEAQQLEKASSTSSTEPAIRTNPPELLCENPFPHGDSMHEDWVGFSSEVTESLRPLMANHTRIPDQVIETLQAVRNAPA